MKVFVYGTLMSGHGNNRLLRNSEFIGEHIVKDHKLYFAWGQGGFPVARQSTGDSVKGELWDIKEDKEVLRNLDALEGEGRMYNRVEVEPDTFMYIGHPDAWHYDRMNECPIVNGNHQWSR